MNTAERNQLQNTLRSIATNSNALADLLEPKEGGQPRDDAAIAKVRAALETDRAEADLLLGRL